jgi:predicted alpha/beta-fold hydrolase
MLNSNKIIFLEALLIVMLLSFSCGNKVEKESLEKEVAIIPAQDSVKVVSNFYFDKSKKNVRQPVVVLVHQFKANKNQWSEKFIYNLINQNYKVIAFDFRNHGVSDAPDVNIEEFLTNKEKAIFDLKAVFSWIHKRQEFDTTRIAVVGTEMGASIAVYSKFFLDTKTIIAISPAKNTFENYTGFFEQLMGRLLQKTKSGLFIAGAGNKICESDANYICNNFFDEPKKVILFETEKNGKDLLIYDSDVENQILKWLEGNL